MSIARSDAATNSRMSAGQTVVMPGQPPGDAAMPGECRDCGLQYVLADLPPGVTARCRRCGATLASFPAAALQKSLSITLTAIVLLAVACTTPFMTASLKGRIQEASLLTGGGALAEGGFWSLAAVVIATTVIVPAVKLGATAYVLIGLRLARPARHLAAVWRWLARLRGWSMVEVYLLGVFVAYVKLGDFYSISVGPACYAIAAVMVFMVALDAILARELVWREMTRRGVVPSPRPAPDAPLVLCEVCGLLGPMRFSHEPCPRCAAARHARKPDSLARSWALVVAALILYVPANLLPVMTVVSMGHGEADTIMSGVKALFAAGMWPLALVVFFASVTVPVVKIAGLVLLLVTTRRGSRWRLRDRTVLYRIVESVGRWSMIDIFMISILVGLVRLGALATIEPGVGAVSFAAVVIITMFAAEAFDPRLMWDSAGENS